MGLLDSIFGGDKPTQKNIDKLILRVKERYAQPEYRREAMEKLIAFGTPEALTAVLARFTVVAQSPHWDEEEKRWLVDEMARLGAPARAALCAFLARENHIALAARALQRLDSTDDYVLDLVGALKARGPDDHRSTQGKAELVACLMETGDARAADAVLPYLDDHGDDVQVIVVDALEKLWGLPGWARLDAERTLQAIVADDARSARVLRHAAHAMCRLKVQVDPARPLAPAVAEDFVVQEGVLASARAAS